MGRFVFVGDVIADDTVDAAELRATVEHVAGGADATLVGNLEIPVCEEDAGAPPLKLVTWRAPASVAARLAAGGFSVLGLANNHSVSWGIGGLMRSVELLREAGIAPIGAGHGLAEAIRPWRSADGAVAVFALNCTVPGESAAAEGREGTLALRVDTRIAIDAMRSVELPVTPPEISGRFDRRQLAPLRERIDEQARAGATVVVMLHWGSPYTLTVFDYQFELSELSSTRARSSSSAAIRTWPEPRAAIATASCSSASGTSSGAPRCSLTRARRCRASARCSSAGRGSASRRASISGRMAWARRRSCPSSWSTACRARCGSGRTASASPASSAG